MVTATTSLLLGIATLTTYPRVTTDTRWTIDRPRVEVWTNRGEDVSMRGDRVRVFVRADRDAFVTVFRVDTDGRVRVLFPREPWEDTFVRRDREYEVEGSGGRDAFTVDDYPGVGYVFAVVSADPFDYGAVVAGDHWDYRLIADGRVRGDPYVALTDLAQRIVPVGYEDWDYDLVPYYVERHYDYPRFACYDCHAYASWTYWDPYAYDCVRFRLVIYDDPWYYPYRYYRGTRVVWVRPFRPAPRYVFKDWGSEARSRERFITRVRETVMGTRERTSPLDRPAPGAIPAPRTRDRASPGTSGVRRDLPDRRDRLEQPERRDRPNELDRSGRGTTGARTPAPVSAPRTTERPTARPREDATPDRTVTPLRGSGRAEPVEPSGRGTTARERPRGADSRAARESPSTRQDPPARTDARGQERRPEPRETRPSAGSRDSPSQPSARTAPRSGGDRPASGSSARGGGGDRSSSGGSARGGTSRPSGGTPSRGGGSRTPELKRRKP
jgi:hypothetical protein